MNNRAKAKLRSGQRIVGAFVALPHPDVCEWLAHLGFDWLVLDMEHGPLSLEMVQRMLQAVKGTDCTAVVRPATNCEADVKRVLDLGAHGIVAPMVETRQDAEQVVRACQYPPRGTRGYGPRRPLKIDRDYLATVEEELLIVALIETRKGIDNAQEILAVPGLDAGVIGPYDLSFDMGYGSPLRWDEVNYTAAYERLGEAARVTGKAAGTFVNEMDRLPWLIKHGHRALLVGEADAFLLRGASMALEAMRTHDTL